MDSRFDYSLVGPNAIAAVRNGLAEASWYRTPIPKNILKVCLERKDAPAIRDTLIWLLLIFLFGYWAYVLLSTGNLWGILFLIGYGVLYASCSDSRWHESGHGTAFKSDYLNTLLYEVASFMVLRESVVWRWSHVRHHSDTIIVGRDPEIAVPRPPSFFKMLGNAFNIPYAYYYAKHLVLHIFGKLSATEKTFIPPEQYASLFWRARVYSLIYLAVIGLSMYWWSWWPLVFVGLPNFYGAFMIQVYGYTQHCGLPENVLDHRINCRTIYMNIIHRFLYWNMNYHTEHHMFPLVPYHQLPKLHEAIKHDLPKVYNSMWDAYKEIIPLVIKQRKDPYYNLVRKLPTPTARYPNLEEADFANQLDRPPLSKKGKSKKGKQWVRVCPTGEMEVGSIRKFSYNDYAVAIYHTQEGFFATDGICTHGHSYLADGFLNNGEIECPKHNGRFDLKTGKPTRSPVCIALRVHPVEVEDGWVIINTTHFQSAEQSQNFIVKSNENLTPTIKELTLSPIHSNDLARNTWKYQPGDYVHLQIPPYSRKYFSELELGRFRNYWEQEGWTSYTSENTEATYRNYSLASNPSRDQDREIRLNVRIAFPNFSNHDNHDKSDKKTNLHKAGAGIGSGYVFSLHPGDLVCLRGPYGEFHLEEQHKTGKRKIVFIGGGAGMAPIRSQISYLLETLQVSQRIEYWYGARSEQDLFYQEYFAALEKTCSNFKFTYALSEGKSTDTNNTDSNKDVKTKHGFIHEVFEKNFFSKNTTADDTDFYLCGPPPMIKAVKDMLAKHGVAKDQIKSDEF